MLDKRKLNISSSLNKDIILHFRSYFDAIFSNFRG